MVRVDSFFIDRFEFPNRAGAAPLTGVDYDRAVELCGRQGKRLCSEDEWARACAGASGRDFPYGASYTEGACAAGKGVKRAQPAGAFARCQTVEGVADLSGNVAEWTSSTLKPGAPQRVVRGGSWDQRGALVSCGARDYFLPGVGGAKHIGFRCCF